MGDIDAPITLVALTGLSGSPEWEETIPSGTPPADSWSEPLLAYDATRDRLVITMGTLSSGGTNEVWAIDFGIGPGGEWIELAPTGPLPPARYGAALGVGEGGERLVLHGGVSSVGSYLSDTWELDFTANDNGVWTALPSSTAAGVRASHAGVLWPDGYFCFYGGYLGTVSGAPVSTQNSLWCIDSVNAPGWFEAGTSAPKPTSRAGACSGYDPLWHRLVLFGGVEWVSGGSPSAYFNEVWDLYPEGLSP